MRREFNAMTPQQPDQEAVTSSIFALGNVSWKLAVSLHELIKREGVIADVLKRVSEALKELSKQCDLIWNAMNKDGRSSGERDDPVQAAILRCLATQSSEAHDATQELGKTCDNLKTALKSGIDRHEAESQAARLAQDVRRSQRKNDASSPASVSGRHVAMLEHNLQRLKSLTRPTPNERRLQSLANEFVRHHEIDLAEQPVVNHHPNEKLNHVEWISDLEELHNNDRVHQEQLALATLSPQSDHRISEGESDDDLEADLVKAALETGAKAYEKAEWEEADLFFREALSGLRTLAPKARTFCDTFHIHYQLAACSYHMQDLINAKAALAALLKHEASTPTRSVILCNAMHTLALIGLREGNVSDSQTYCDKALKGRRRHLGKSSEAAYESTMLMAHICTLLSNSQQARLYRSLVPHPQREVLTARLQEALDTKIVFSETASMSTMSLSGESDRHTDRGSSAAQQENVGMPMPPKQILAHMDAVLLAKKVDATETASFQSPVEKECADLGFCTAPEVVEVVSNNALDTPLTRRELLEKIGCKPNDRIEDAVCDHNHAHLLDLLEKQKGFWRSKVRKRGRPERVTALHFAALFGDIAMARSLLTAKLFDINVVPHGYSTRLTPLKFAIGARQTEMIEFLIANGARPVEPDSWSTLAGHVLNRSWLAKTVLSPGIERNTIPLELIAIYRILLKHGWNVNKPFDTKAGTTVLHQAVLFESTFGVVFDDAVQSVVVPFLIRLGADPLQVDADGRSPQEVATKAGKANHGGLPVDNRIFREPAIELNSGHADYG